MKVFDSLEMGRMSWAAGDYHHSKKIRDGHVEHDLATRTQ